ncbi:Peptidase S46 [Ekhidna lutea]|uniref:Dipeptidyl-peptidase n=1 Tax=Ekhidna lutea TaxID=447679 RepID=A0A239M035_EKHLU|nr:S46 family peptidase [Ekhidna lutea]SNT35413.1 Peptidase S46 [Ekhidna lutea]
MRLLRVLFLFVFVQAQSQQGGMWIPSLLEGMNEEEMSILGAELTASDIYDIENSSFKDAIANFNGGCTGAVISPQGLLLTNHHCGFGQIQSHSSIENDYLKDGFWAQNRADELPNEGLYAEFIVRIDEVTDRVLEGVTESMSEEEAQVQIRDNITAVQESVSKEEWQDSYIRPFYQGNQYYLFVTERYEDIRLVGAPPTSIGKFGSDTDNWVFPRHTGDFSFFRIYADANNRPAKYSEDNVPYTPKHFFPVSAAGVKEGDFTLIFGFPGRTSEYLPAVAMEHITKYFNPSNIAIREAALKVIDAGMKSSDEIRIKYASKQARIANAWKKWIGENLGIEKTDAIESRRMLEEKFKKSLKEKDLEDKYGHILPQFEELYSDFASVDIKRRNFIEVFLVTNELMQMMFRAYQLEQKVLRNNEALDDARDEFKGLLTSIYKNYDAAIDKGVFKNVMPFYTENVDATIYDGTAFTSQSEAEKLLQGSAKQMLKKLNADPAYAYAKPMIERFYQSINPEYIEKIDAIDALQKEYMKALMEVLPDARYYPDANGTLRVTYGQVRGYSPRDAVYYNPVSYLDGVIEKYVPGDYEFDVPEKLLSLYEAKDYGPYADSTGKVPVCFLGTNHTTGGNSGSPAIDAQGNLIGLNFDRVWEGTMSDINYDPEICRNIMVDMRYILFIVDKFANADHLIEEMAVVNPDKVLKE